MSCGMAMSVSHSSSIQPSFLSPHRKRGWRRHDSRFISTSSSLITYRKEEKRRVESSLLMISSSCLGSLRNVGLRPRIGGYGNLGIGLRGGIYKTHFEISINLGTESVARAMRLLEISTMSPSFESTKLGSEDILPVFVHSLMNIFLDNFATLQTPSLVAAFILSVLVGGYLTVYNKEEVGDSLLLNIEGGGGRGIQKSVAIVSQDSVFNRFVMKRCPSISSNFGVVTLGKRQEQQTQNLEASRVMYQRQCLHTADGGVVAIDWPTQLEFAADNGLDNTLLLVPGTTEGSRDEGVQKFVMDAMRHGYFPVVLNPRGCAASPLTTPRSESLKRVIHDWPGTRVFTAADSDDVRVAVRHIIHERPGYTLMGVSWGFGANMLAKYLGEEAGAALLMAAVCISNPFDLEKSSIHLSRTRGPKPDLAMAEGLVNIVRENQMLFAGEKKGYEVSRALAAKTVREFDTAMSRVSYGFETLEEFYAAASSASKVGNVQVPLLCIQGEDDATPVASIPYQALQANPYTTALVAQSPTTKYPENSVVKQPGSASTHDWSHTIALEWLAAVEVALLKGRHPLLDVRGLDKQIKNVPKTSLEQPKSPPHKEDIVSTSETASQSTLDGSPDDVGQEYAQDASISDRDATDDFSVQKESEVPTEDTTKNQSVSQPQPAESKEVVEEMDGNDGAVQPVQEELGLVKLDNPQGETSPPAEEPAGESEGEPEGEPEEGSEAIQMRAAAQSIMNVLDITMPGTLSDEKKAQVLTAVGKGETIVSALQEAVPEDVRGSMAAAVSGAVQARGLNFNLVGFSKNMPAPSLPAGFIDKIKGKLTAVSSPKAEAPPGQIPTLGLENSSPISSGEQKKEGHEAGNSSNDNSKQSKEAGGDSEKPKPEESKSDDKVPSDTQNKTPNGDGHGEGHAQAEAPETKVEKVDEGDKGKSSEGSNDVGKDNIGKEAEKNSNSEKNNAEGEKAESTDNKAEAAKDSKGKISEGSKDVGKDNVGKEAEENSNAEKNNAEGEKAEWTDNRDEAAKDSKGESSESKGGSVDNKASSEGKNELATETQEKMEPKGGEKETGAPTDHQDAGTDNNNKTKPDNAVDSNNNTQCASEEIKPEGNAQPPPSPTSAPSEAPPAPAPAPATAPASPPKTGMAPPIDMGLAFQALTGFDDSTQMAVTNVFGVVESMLEQMEKDKKGSENGNGASAAGPQEEPTDDSEDEKTSGGKEDKAKDDQKQKQKQREPTNDTHNTEDGAAKTSTVNGDRNFNDVGKGDDTSESLKNTDEVAVSSGHHEQGEGISGADQKMQVSEVEGTRPSSGRLSLTPTKTLSEDSFCRTLSKVLVTRRVGSFTLVETMLKDEAPQVHTGQNGATAKSDRSFTDLTGVSSRQRSGNGGGQQITPIGLRQQRDVDAIPPILGKVPGITIEKLQLDVDMESQQEQDHKAAAAGIQTIEVEATDIKDSKPLNMVESLVTDALKLELLRRLGIVGMESLGVDLDKEVAKVAHAVAEAVRRWKQNFTSGQADSGKLGMLQSESIVSTLGTVVGGTHILGGLVPLGVLAGVVLASLGAVYLIVTDNQESKSEEEADESAQDVAQEELEQDISEPSSWDSAKRSAVDVPVLEKQISFINTDNQEDDFSEFEEEESQQESDSTDFTDDDSEGEKEGNGNNNRLMGMMAAAVSGGATLAGMSMANNDNATEAQDGQNTADGDQSGTEPGNPKIISGIHPLAEKALSVAAPVVPTTEDGEIDHERLVAMLAELGQRGGFFRLIGKVALLWGGLRGAMSLTDRLLVFFRVSERPLHLRLVNFSALIVLLWSPILVPVLPSLLHQWATKSPNAVADAASVVGLYGAILILITIWGKRVRGYNKPLLKYGLRLYSRKKVQDVARGIALGVGLVTALYCTNAILGYMHFNWTGLLATNAKFPGVAGLTFFTSIKVGKLLGQALGIGLAVALVEEVLFRAWLQEEIAVDIGFHKAVFISALAFALVHWSPAAMPGLWFLSVALAGARAKTGQNLAFPIGLHSGLVAANYVITVGGVAQFLPHAPAWFTGAHVGNPLAGALGTAMTAMMAVILYPHTQTLVQ